VRSSSPVNVPKGSVKPLNGSIKPKPSSKPKSPQKNEDENFKGKRHDKLYEEGKMKK